MTDYKSAYNARRRQRQGLAQVSRIRKILRQIPIQITKELKVAVAESAALVRDDMVALAPVDDGQLRSEIDMQVGRDGFTARIGFITEKAQRKAFYARFLEDGTKGSPEHNIPPLSPHPFMAPALDLNRSKILDRMRDGMDRVFREAAGVGGD